MCRLDAGTFGTMGVGLGFAVAAAAVERSRSKSRRVVCVEGDSAFGFSGMEVETMCRLVFLSQGKNQHLVVLNLQQPYFLLGIIYLWSLSWSIIMAYTAE